ncbi:uncharacterized protein [Clytia hemisphaerica]|uniref:Apple domain-containing protein n=1 Tax=Clytia hemisphaerica TaxID=252671 RepID=A0A7M5UGL4_9CNID
MNRNLGVWLLISSALFCSIEGGVLRYNSGGQSSDGSALWLANFVKTEKVWLKDPVNTASADSKVISSDVIQHDQGDDKCRHKCIVHPECRSYNIALLGVGEFYCELTKYHYKDTVVDKVAQGEDGKDNWSVVEP